MSHEQSLSTVNKKREKEPISASCAGKEKAVEQEGAVACRLTGTNPDDTCACCSAGAYLACDLQGQ